MTLNLMNTDSPWNTVTSFLTSLSIEKGLAVNRRTACQRDLIGCR